MENLFDKKDETKTGSCPFHSLFGNGKSKGSPRLTHNKIPDEFLEWLVTSHVRFLENMINGQPMRYFSAHLPTMITWTKEGQFPVNMTVKGIGLIPQKELLENYTKLFELTAKNALSSNWDTSLSERIGVNKELYSNINHFEPSLLGGLEIFEGKCYENLKENPNTSLLYVGMSQTLAGMKYVSFQVNGEVELLEKGNPYYRYLLASRKLFEFDKFHLYQPDYPFGYLIKVKEVRDKSPFTREDTNEK